MNQSNRLEVTQCLWSFMLKTAPKSLVEEIEKEWNRSFKQVFMLMSSMDREQLNYLVLDDCPATQFLALQLQKLAKPE